MPNDPDFETELNALKTATPEDLQKRWKTLCRKPCPAHLSRNLIVLLIAYRLQAARFGDLEPDVLRYLNCVSSAGSSGKQPARYGADKTRYSPGTVFVREHDGQLHRAIKTIRGFEWNGREFQSLSAVAQAITGTHWNGLRFFGVPTGKAKHHART